MDGVLKVCPTTGSICPGPEVCKPSEYFSTDDAGGAGSPIMCPLAVGIFTLIDIREALIKAVALLEGMGTPPEDTTVEESNEEVRKRVLGDLGVDAP